MKKYYSHPMLYIAVVSLIFSCNSEGIEKQGIRSDGEHSLREGAITVENSHLKFSNPKMFKLTVSQLNSEKDLSKWEQQFKGFKSMNQAYKELDKKDFEKVKNAKDIIIKKEDPDGASYEKAVVDNLLASLLNHQGIVQIGDTIYKVNDIEVRKAHHTFANEISNPKSSHVEVSKVENIPINFSDSRARKNDVDEYDRTQAYVFDGVDHRFSFNYWARRYDLQNYWSTGYTIAHQRRNWWGWGSSNAFNWSGDYRWKITIVATNTVEVDVQANAFPLYEGDQYQPYRYSQTPDDTYVRQIYTPRIYWHAYGRDGKTYQRNGFINTTI